MGVRNTAIFDNTPSSLIISKDEPKVLDYSDPNNWIHLETNPTKDVDSLFFYGTVFYTSSYENGIGVITDDMKNNFPKILDHFNVNNIFSDYTNVYIPYHHQLTFDKAIELGDHDAFMDSIRKSMEMDDIVALLDYYFQNCNNGKPFILYGHSQGSAVIQLILEDYMKKHPEYYKNMVAAYSIGFGVTRDWLNANPQVKLAQGESDTGVIISWNTEGPGTTMDNIILGKNTVLINPLNWKTDETYADKSLNIGSQVTEKDGTHSFVPGQNDAQIDSKRGSLICTTSTEYDLADFTLALLGDKSLHSNDYVLYYQNIKENGLKRIRAFQSRNTRI